MDDLNIKITYTMLKYYLEAKDIKCSLLNFPEIMTAETIHKEFCNYSDASESQCS